MVLGDLQRLVQAVEANWCTAWASLGQVRDQLPTLVDDTPGYLRVFTPAVPEMLVNTIIRFKGPLPIDPGDLERIIAPYRRHRLPFQWWMVMGAEPRDLREHLRRLDLQSCGPATCMALPLEHWSPPDALGTPLADEVAQRVGTREDGNAAHAVICDVFYVPAGPMARWTTDNPAFQLYLTRLRGHPVAALATLRDGDTVGVYHVGTRAGFRRHGMAGRLLAMALREARAEGARLATLTATPEARALYDALGFHTCGAIEQWIPGPDLMAQLTYGGRVSRFRAAGW
jgi:GNAT superfamily N-acetyltransferase